MSEKRECYSCGYPSRDLEEFETRTTDKCKVLLCGLCRKTLTGNATINPRETDETTKVMETICYVGNVILGEIALMPGARRIN